MKWLSKWFQNQLKKAIESAREDEKRGFAVPIEKMTIAGLTGGSNKLRLGPDLYSQGIQFTLHRATGGYVVEMSEYDPIQDRSHKALHVLHASEDLGPALSKIITFENLKR